MTIRSFSGVTTKWRMRRIETYLKDVFPCLKALLVSFWTRRMSDCRLSTRVSLCVCGKVISSSKIQVDFFCAGDVPDALRPGSEWGEDWMPDYFVVFFGSEWELLPFFFYRGHQEGQRVLTTPLRANGTP